MSYALKLAERYHSLDQRAVGNEVLQKVKECILDYLSCVYAGLPYKSSDIVRDVTVQNYARGKCTLVGNKKKLVPSGAAFVNSAVGHAAELDDNSNEAGGHVGVIVLPVAIAVAEDLGLSGRDVLMATVIGYDMHIKVGRAANPQGLFARGFHPTSVCGMFGAAITAARLMGLTTEEMANALGIVGSFVAGNLECYSDGSLTKRLNPGIASSSGILAATLARKGYTGPKSILEGPRGFFHSYCDNPKPQELDKTNGFEIENISFKPYACCRFNHSTIDAILDIRSANKLDHKRMRSVTVELAKTSYDIVGQPAEIKFNPKNVLDGQFSVAYSAAIACIEGKAFIDEYSERSIVRSDVRDFMKKIDVKYASDLDKFFPEAFPARVTVITDDGRTLIKEVMYAKGDPKNPLSWEELVGKFDALTASLSLSNNRKIRIIESILGLEHTKDIKEFTRLLS